jgi:hypothetical protein
VNKVDQLILDFHYINYDFCTSQSYSNEKVSTLLAIMDFTIHAMVKNHMMVEDGYKMLKDILDRHKCQRPPFSIFIFTDEEVKQINEFMLKSFFRHFCLYEYAFKPKVELMLVTEPIGGFP